MSQFLETGKTLYVLTAICLLEVLSGFVACDLYKRLIKEADNMTLTENRLMRELKQKAGNAHRLNQDIHNTQIYLGKQLYGYRFIGPSLNGWTGSTSQMTLPCFLAGGVATFGAYWFRYSNYYIVLYDSMGILTGPFAILIDYGINLGGEEQQLVLTLQDHLENPSFSRLSEEASTAIGMMGDAVGETTRSGSSKSIRPTSCLGRIDGTERMERAVTTKEPEEAPQPVKRERASRASRRGPAPQQEPDVVNSRRDVDYLKRSLEQIVASREESRSEGNWIKALTPDEVQLVNDILKKYLV